MSPQTVITWLDRGDLDAIEKWDRCVQSSVRGHYCQLSSWLESFRAYGFDHAIVVARVADGTKVGDCGVFIIGNRLMSVLTVPIGPLVETGWDELAISLLEQLRARARARGCVLLQLTPAVAQAAHHQYVLDGSVLPLQDFTTGAPFGTGLAPAEMNLLTLPEVADLPAWRVQMLAGFEGKAQRYIKTAEKRGISIIEAKTSNELQEAYAIIEANGRQQGYSTRSWDDFGRYLVAQVERGHALVLLARYEGKPVGGYYGVIAGRRLSYMMGGTVRMKPDLNVGYLLQWTAMTKAHLLGLGGYDLTSGGTAAVGSFKRSFNPTHVKLAGPRYEVLSPLRFQLLKRAYPFLRRNKASVGAALSKFNRLLHRR